MPAVAESVSIWFRLLTCHARILAELRQKLDERVTIPRFDLLASLHRHDGQTLAALSRDLLVTAGNVTGLVDRAERDDLVQRRADPSDRRLARVFLTDRGRALIRELLPIHDAQVHEILGGLSAPQRRELRKQLGTLRDHLAPRAPGADAVRASRREAAPRASRRAKETNGSAAKAATRARA